jgi:sucrose phosphorylase
LERGANLNLLLSQAHNGLDGFNVHQINGTFYSLVDCNDSAYLIARAIQFFVPGVPQVYYVGFLAGKNDLEAVVHTGENREINRHNYSLEEIDQEVKRPVVQKLIELIKLRNSHPAFNGDFQLGTDNTDSLILSWHNHDLYAKMTVDFKDLTAEITYIDPQTSMKKIIVL